MTESLYLGFAKKHQALLNRNPEGALECVHTDKLTARALAEINRVVEETLTWREVDQPTFDTLLVQTYETGSSAAMQMVEEMEDDLDLFRAAAELNKHAEDLLGSDDEAPIIRLINAILSEAIKEEASDVHIETFPEHLSVRFRVDGVLRPILEPQRVLAPLLISRIKVMAKLDIAEKRIPQDGRLSVQMGGRSLDVRVSTMPASHGERIVMRLLEKKADKLALEALGFGPLALETVQKLIKQPHGILLVTGPTGAGKTTTLYAALTSLNQSSRNILTIEDPVEYDLAGIGQTQVNTKVGMTFATGLRAILRQDPDVVMIGEIRDTETAEIAVQASLTGHLVLSTLHTNTAIGALTRLQDMGVEKFLLSTSLIGVIGQRLVRVLCPHCRQLDQATPMECRLMGESPDTDLKIYRAQGCDQCHQIGYSGRIGIYEVVYVDETVRAMINEGSSEMTLEAYVRQNLPSMRRDGIARVRSGQTTLEEILRVTTEDT